MKSWMWRLRSCILENMEPRRRKRVEDRIREETSELLLMRVKDPRIGFVTVTGVEISSNLRHAKIFYSVLGDEQQRKSAQEGLVSAAGFIKRELAARLQLKYMPDIVFHYDPSIEYGERIEKILKGIENRTDESD